MQRVVRHIIAADVLPHIVLRPVGQRIEFSHTVRFILFLHVQFSTCLRLCAALAGDPCLVTGKGAIQRLDLADPAAFLTHLNAVVKRIQAVLFNIGSDSFRLRPIRRDVVIVGLFDTVQHAQRFSVQAPGFQREDGNPVLQLTAQDQVGQHHVFGRQAGSKDRRRIFGGDFFQGCLGGGDQVG